MTQKSLVLSVVTLLSLTHLTACLENGKSGNGRTTIRKGQGQPGAPTAATKPATIGAGGSSRPSGQKTTPQEQISGQPGTPSVDGKSEAQANLSSGQNCQSLQAKAKSLGFKADSVESQVAQRKLKIQFYLLTKSQGEIKNPLVYFVKSSFQEATEQDLENLKKISDSTKTDAIMIDMRGAGCSGGLPSLAAASSEFQQFGSRTAVQDAEIIRKKLLKDQKWTLLAHRSGGAVALRYIELAPQGLQAVHIADFTPASDMKKLMRERASQEKSNWEQLLKETKLDEAIIEKALTQLDSQKCGENQKCRDLVHVLATKLGQTDQWPFIKETFQKLADGKSSAQDLLNELNRKKQKAELNVISRILDLDSDTQLKACQSQTLTPDEKFYLSLCRLENLIGLPQIQNWSQKLRHEPLNFERIKQNATQNRIQYSLSAAGLSTLYPLESYQEQQAKLDEILESSFFKYESLGSEIFLNSEFLKSINTRN